jgi:hypothetical protein
MEKPFTRVNLSDISVIMATIRVLVEELPCHVVMGHILVLECLLSGVHVFLWLHPVMPGIKWCCFLMIQL